MNVHDVHVITVTCPMVNVVQIIIGQISDGPRCGHDGSQL